jgi:hypothetical protein
MHRFPLVIMTLCLCGMLLAGVCSAQKLQAPTSGTAGEATTISTAGSGAATFYLLGPGVTRKSEINLGEDVPLAASDLRTAGMYLAIICSGECQSATFYVVPAKPAKLTFLVHPSRVPVAQSDAVSGVAMPFDQFQNLVLGPAQVEFQLSAGKNPLLSQMAHTQDGIAWFRTASGKSAGALRVAAILGDVSALRAVQQVASEPCNLTITGQRTSSGILVQTAPVHDCAGNPVPDGTIVSFTATGANGKSTVDAPIKQGVARAEITAPEAAVISAASGVVMGNELHIGAQP